MENMIYADGYVNKNGAIVIPGVSLEDGTDVEVVIHVCPGRLEVAIFPTDEDDSPEDTDEGFLDE